MPIIVEKLPDEPIIVVICQEPMNYVREAPKAFDQILALRDTIYDSPEYYIVFDASAVKMGFGDMVTMMGEVKRVSQQPRSDLLVVPSLVGSGSLVEMAVNAVQQTQYGSYKKVPLFTSVEQALESIRTDLTG